MASGMSLLSCLLLACALNFANAQPLEESVFKQLSARELREISLRQNPALLDLAARTGESVTVIINSPSQGAIVQENVNTVLDCGPWLRNYPGGTVEWYLYPYEDLDHTILGMRSPQDPSVLNADDSARARILGQFNEIFNITRVLISMDAEDSSRGIYECEVCVARGNPLFEVCHSANTTVATAGRPPIIDRGVGRMPFSRSPGLDIYNIASTICLQIDPLDPSRNIPRALARLRCADVLQDDEMNIPTPLPAAAFTWTHISLDGREANFAVNRFPDDLDDSMYMPPQEFSDTFPLIGAQSSFTVSTEAEPAASSLDFSTNNVTRNVNDTKYEALMEAFGFWTCTLNNSLGMETATTFISDMCGAAIPSIISDCREVGEAVTLQLSLVERGQAVPIPAGCDVCIKQAAELWLTLTCPTNVANFPSVSVLSYKWTDENGNLVGENPTFLVQDPGSYTCTVDFGDGGSDSQTTSVGYVPDIQLEYARDGSRMSGCARLRTDAMFSPDDVCAFVGEEMMINCTSGQENVTATPIDMVSRAPRSSFTIMEVNDDELIVCQVINENALVEERCAGIVSLNLTVYDPATILVDPDETCSVSAGEIYGLVPTPPPGGSIILCCDVVGFPTPAANWTRVLINADGVAVEVPVGLLDTDYSVDSETNRLTITNYNASEDDGTYVCRAENIAGIDHATVTLSSRGDATGWQVSPWSECDPNCVGGTRTRSVWCASIPEGVVVADALCDCTIKPASSEQCTNVPGLGECFLEPLWKTGEFSECSRGCAGGVRYRAVYCASLYDGERLDANRCRRFPMPPAYDICFNRCCVTDVYRDYCRYTGTGPCDNPIYQQHCCWTCRLTEFP